MESTLNLAPMDVIKLGLILAEPPGDGLDSSYIAAGATIAAAAIAAAVALFLHFLGQRKAVRDRKREICARAVADALDWLELPYRIRRRVDDEPATLKELADRTHDLQEALDFHLSWLRVDLPKAYEKYDGLVSAVKSASASAMAAAWEASPVADPAQMIIGDLGIDKSNVDSRISDLVHEIRHELGWRKLLLGF